MKKLIALTLVLCLVLCVLSGCGKSTVEYYEEEPAAETAETAEAAPADTTETVAATEEPAVSIGQGGTGFDTYPADTVVATINGADATWLEYFYWLRYYTMYIQQFAASYGFIITSWEDHDLSEENTNAEVVIMNAKANLIQDHVIMTETAKLGVELTEEDEAELAALFEQNADSVTGDGDGVATEEEIKIFEAYLGSEMFVDRAFFDQFNMISLLSDRGFEFEYGDNGANYSDEDTAAFAEENNLLGAKHILLMTVDPETNEPLSDEEIAGKYALAEDILAQLQAVENDPAALEALFDELTAEYTEDTGFASYPDGYVFSEGEMVAAFEEAVKALEVGELSDIVESEYGYHVILRIPIDPNAIIGTDSAGNEVSLRYVAAAQQFNSEISAWVEAAEVVWNDGFETPDVAAIFG